MLLAATAHSSAQLMKQYGWKYGNGVRFAQELGVSPATVSRDVTAIFKMADGPVRCPCCGAVEPREEVDERATPWTAYSQHPSPRGRHDDQEGRHQPPSWVVEW